MDAHGKPCASMIFSHVRLLSRLDICYFFYWLTRNTDPTHFTSPGSHSTTAGNITKNPIVTASAKKNGITPRKTS